MTATEARARRRARIAAWWFSIIFPYPMGVPRVGPHCLPDHQRVWLDAQEVRKLLYALRQMDWNGVSAVIGPAQIPGVGAPLSPAAFNSFLYGNTTMQDSVRQAWWNLVRRRAQQDGKPARLIADIQSLKPEETVSDTWLYLNDNHVQQWPPERVTAGQSHRLSYPMKIDDLAMEVIEVYGFPCICHSINILHEYPVERPATTWAAWLRGDRWNQWPEGMPVLEDTIRLLAPESRLDQRAQIAEWQEQLTPYALVQQRIDAVVAATALTGPLISRRPPHHA